MAIIVTDDSDTVTIEVESNLITIKTVVDTLPLAYLALVDTVPISATDTGIAHTIAVDSTYLYICTATNTWVRTLLITWHA